MDWGRVGSATNLLTVSTCKTKQLTPKSTKTHKLPYLKQFELTMQVLLNRQKKKKN